MLNDCVGDKEGQFSALYESCEQERIFGADCGGIKQISVDRHAGAANGKTCGVQISNAAIRLQQLFLKHGEAEMLGSANKC